MVVVKIVGANEWWSAETSEQINAMLAEASISGGHLLVCKQIDTLPPKVTKTYHDEDHNVTVYKPTSPEALTNAQHQRNFRERRSETHRLLRVWVPIDRYAEAKQWCEELS
jgi:hypothetical protein